jgi:hypothetical protein
MTSLLWVLFWIGAIIGSIFAGYAAGTLGVLSFLVLVSALAR